MLDPAESEKWNAFERRVERLEEDMGDVKVSLRSIEGKVDRLVEGVAEIRGRITGIEGRLSQAPTWIQLLVALIATWGAGAAIIAAAVKYIPK
jgi:hypothetical protein